MRWLLLLLFYHYSHSFTRSTTFMVAWIVVVEKRQTTQELTKSEISHQFGQKDCREGFVFIFTLSNSNSNSELQFGAHLHFYSLCFLYFEYVKWLPQTTEFQGNKAIKSTYATDIFIL